MLNQISHFNFNYFLKYVDVNDFSDRIDFSISSSCIKINVFVYNPNVSIPRVVSDFRKKFPSLNISSVVFPDFFIVRCEIEYERN